MNKITYIKGDLFSVPITGKRIIPHICNDIGGWGAGFVLALSKQWREPEEKYRVWHRDGQYTTTRKPSPTENDHSPSKGYDINTGEKKYIPEEVVVPFALGMVQYVSIPNSPTVVCNMIAQHGTIGPGIQKPIRYAALMRCLERIETACRGIQNVEIHAPKFGAGLAGGDWNVIEPIINEIWIANGLKVFIYEI